MGSLNNVEHDYLKLLHDILHNGIEKDTRNGRTRSVFGRQIRHDMSLGFPLLTTKKMPFQVIATELLWFLRGDTNIKFLVDNDCHIWDGDAYKNYTNSSELRADLSKEEFIHNIKMYPEFAKEWGNLGPIYGTQWRRWHTGWDVVEDKSKEAGVRRVEYGIDQITNLINDLKTNPDSRRLMVNAWNVGELDLMTLPPCHYGFQVYTRELSYEERRQMYRGNLLDEYGETKSHDELTIADLDRLHIPTRAISLMWSQRSADAFLGLPFNIASYALLLHIIAEAVNMIPDELIGNLGDVHLYENHLDQAKEQLTREPMPLPKLNINTEWWPTESGECGIMPIDAVSVFNAVNDVNFCRCLLEEDLQLYNYQSHPAIKAPLSN
jgi:thymidylate synthase